MKLFMKTYLLKGGYWKKMIYKKSYLAYAYSKGLPFIIKFTEKCYVQQQ